MLAAISFLLFSWIIVVDVVRQCEHQQQKKRVLDLERKLREHRTYTNC